MEKNYWADIHYVKEKLDAGADFVVTQLFYDVNIFIKWVKDCRSVGITAPIVPGVSQWVVFRIKYILSDALVLEYYVQIHYFSDALILEMFVQHSPRALTCRSVGITAPIVPGVSERVVFCMKYIIFRMLWSQKCHVCILLSTSMNLQQRWHHHTRRPRREPVINISHQIHSVLDALILEMLWFFIILHGHELTAALASPHPPSQVWASE